MVDIIFKDYWSRSEAFLLPLTGLKKKYDFEMKSYLFWNSYSIEDYKLMVVFHYEDYDKFVAFCREEIFPILDSSILLEENYDYHDRAIFILDMSEWAFDIDMFLYGKYSKMSKEAKTLITQFHRKDGKIKCYLYSAMYPNEEQSILNNVSAIDYIVNHYDLDPEEMHKIGEVGGLYDRNEETLLTHIEQLC